MNEWLANLYNTNGAAAVDLEKVAQAAILEKLANQEGIDLSGLTEEQQIALANEVMQAEAGAPQEPQVDPQDPNAQLTPEQEAELAKEAEAKFEEADFLGRVMAHAYTQELEKIAAEGGQPGAIERAGRHISDPVGRAGGAVGRAIGRAGRWVGRTATRGAGGVARAARAVGSHVGTHRGKYTIGGLGAAALGTGAAIAKHHHDKGKTKTAFDMLAEKRAAEMLAESGIDPTTGQELQPQQPQQPQVAPAPQGNPDETFSAALDEQAAQILQDAGYEFVPDGQ